MKLENLLLVYTAYAVACAMLDYNDVAFVLMPEDSKWYSFDDHHPLSSCIRNKCYVA